MAEDFATILPQKYWGLKTIRIWPQKAHMDAYY